MDGLPSEAQVLVCIITRPKDLALAREQHWYRIPMLHAPRGLAADAVAFYQTAAFGADRWRVRWVAPLLRISIASRRELLPDEPHHPRAAQLYYRLELGALEQLPLTLTSRRLRRVTFIPTSYGQLLRAGDLRELWHPPEAGPAGAAVWGAGVGRR